MKRKWVRVTLLAAGVVLILFVLLSLTLLALLTSSAPIALPEVAVTQEEEDAMVERWVTFQHDLSSGRASDPVQFSSRDMNIFFSMVPRLRSRVYGAFEAGRIRVQFSAPLLPWLKSRYINGTVTAEVKIRNESLVLDVTSCRVNGHALPRWLCRQLGRKGLNPEAYWVLDEYDLLRYLEAIEIREGAIWFTPRHGASGPGTGVPLGWSGENRSQRSKVLGCPRWHLWNESGRTSAAGCRNPAVGNANLRSSPLIRSAKISVNKRSNLWICGARILPLTEFNESTKTFQEFQAGDRGCPRSSCPSLPLLHNNCTLHPS